ncbi:asparagine synthetase B family protein [Sphaerisporangium sp. NPDC049003]|uniref:asparagine synthetase B family protein n=1 Tax=Sphaerisporangium sp. NPDC049003 TaxID=3364517 RepID=UPI003718B350
MCGITAEIAGPTGGVPGTRVQVMLSEIRHRGDTEHFGGVAELPGAALGCNRLAIVDRATAAQPMSDTARNVWATFNGEIYNHAELRRELAGLGHRFQTASDTEVLVHGYREWGADLPLHLDGMFAFVVYDASRRSFLCARDRFGVKPLYWARDGDRLLFASEIKCFLPIQVTPREFPPGHLMVDGAGPHRYDERDDSPLPDGEDELVAGFRGLMDNAVRKRVQTDLPIGVIYSGGVDSAAVLGLAARHHPDVTAISVGFPGAPDLDFAERSCRDLGIRQITRHLEYGELIDSMKSIVQQVETFEVIDIMDSCVMAPAYEVARELGLKVVLVGDGSDESLAGYELFREHPDPVAMSRYRVMNLHRTDLQRVDRLSMMNTVEARVPFLDREVVDFAWKLPMEYKFRDGIEKWILRAAISGVIPDYLAWRPKIRMPQGTGLLFQLIDFARGQETGLDGELLREIGLDQPEAAYFLQAYLDAGYPLPPARYRRPGWDFAANGYFVFQE